MTRSVKDLRELICVSRLTMQESDEDEDELTRPLTALSIYGAHSVASSSSTITKNLEELSLAPKSPTEERDSKSMCQKRKGTRLKRPCVNQCGNTNNNASFDLKKFKVPLPPLESRPSSGSSIDSDCPGCRDVKDQEIQGGNFDGILQYIDSDVINEWLTRANAMVTDLSTWCNSKDNFVGFADFILAEFPEDQRLELLKMEVGILQDELSLVFDQGLEQGQVNLPDLSRLITAILREYPGRLYSPSGAHVFLNILDTLSSERTEEYKRLLADVKISTRNQEFAKSLLAIRAFLLLSVWSNIVNFYRRFKSGDLLSEPVLSSKPTSVTPSTSTVQKRAYQAVQHGFLAVLHYLVRSRELDLGLMEKENRSLVFEAVMHNQPRVLHFLLSKAPPELDINRPSDSGNTPLHAAANCGYAEVVGMLLDKGQALVNCTNPKCDDATPLHLAVMQGHMAVCKRLLEAGANPKASMNGVTPIKLAQDMSHPGILALLAKRNQLYDYEEVIEAENMDGEEMES